MYTTKILSFCLLAAIFFGCAFANVEQARAASTVSVHVFGASSIWWLAVMPQNDNSATTKVELKDSSSSSFVTMASNAGWGYYTYTSTSGGGFKAPLTLRLTSASGSQITVQLSGIIPDAVVDTGASFGSSSSSTSTQAPANTAAPTTKPTTAPTTKPSSTSAPSTSAPTTKPTTAPTAAPTTKPTTKPTTAPSTPANTDLCAVTPTSSEPVKLLVPLYVYPGAAWDQLVAAASQVKIVAIINPNSGPLSTVDSSYSTYMTKLANAGIEMVGYVHTTYGQRAIADVKADIDTWASKYPLIKGIFLDEASDSASEISYYTQVYQYVMSKSGYVHSILNPGVQPDAGYVAISTNIVVFENYGSSLASTTLASWVTCAPSAAAKAGYKYKFSGIAHTTAAGNEAAYVQAMINKGMGMVYVTDGAGGCCTYNSLVSYFAQEAASVASLN